jgi:hypothetical protein
MLLLQVNNNSFGLAPADQNVAVGTLAPGASGSAQVPMAYNPAKLAQGPANMKLQVRNNLQLLYYNVAWCRYMMMLLHVAVLCSVIKCCTKLQAACCLLPDL